jgi:hypothetical protein
MWQPRERAQFEAALERVLEGDGSPPLKLAALATCHVIGSPRLLGAAARAELSFDEASLDDVAEVAAPRARLLRHAHRLQHDIVAVIFLLEKAVRDPENPVADKLLDRIDVRDLFAAMHASNDEEVRAEAGRRLISRGHYQRARLVAALDLDDGGVSVDVPLDDLLAS